MKLNIKGMQDEYVHRSVWKAAVLGSLTVVIALLAARQIALVSVVGAILLAFPALHDPNYFKLGVLAIYSFGVVVPTIWMAMKGPG
jgi:hypothetical protein